MIRRPPISTLFPSATLFRSQFELAAHRLLDGIADAGRAARLDNRSEEHTSELQSPKDLVCRLLLEKNKRRSDRTPDTAPRGRRQSSRRASSGSGQRTRLTASHPGSDDSVPVAFFFLIKKPPTELSTLPPRVPAPT